MRKKLLEVKNLKQYFCKSGQTVKAVDDVSFDIYEGEVLGLVGESGSGKSTTGRSIIGLYNITDGQVYYDGKLVNGQGAKASPKEVAKKMQMIFQDPYASLNPRMKVRDIIAEGIDVNGLAKSSEERAKKVDDLLRTVGLNPSHGTRYPHEFSGGMRQRVMIAIAMAVRPDLLIADEPTTALDVTVQAQILDLMKEIQKQEGNSIIIITHDLEVVADMADDIIVMYAGQIVEEGSVDEIFNNPSHPYTRKLLEAVPKLNMNRNEALSAIEGTPPDLYKPPLGCAFFDRCDEAMVVCEKNMPDFYNIKEYVKFILLE